MYSYIHDIWNFKQQAIFKNLAVMFFYCALIAVTYAAGLSF